MKKASMALLALALGTALSASASPIYSDDFERTVADTVGGGWAELESDAIDVSLIGRSSGGQQMQLRDNDPLAVASQLDGISTVGFNDITLAYDWAPTNNTESGDWLWVEWRDGPAGNWATIAQHALIGPAAHQSASVLVANAGGVGDFEFRFRVAVDANNEGAMIDNVLLSGNGLAARNVVPEPGGLALAGLGLGLLALLGRPRARQR